MCCIQLFFPLYGRMPLKVVPITYLPTIFWTTKVERSKKDCNTVVLILDFKVCFGFNFCTTLPITNNSHQARCH